jgi:predicted XRE-type DNA-binding protein
MRNGRKVTESSGNVFADLGFANPEEELLKAKLVREIRAIIKRRKLTQT